MSKPLMPKATAVWLVDNTSLTFDQIADFCGLHALEIKGIADGEVGVGIRGLDPVAAGQLEREEIERCQTDESARLVKLEPKVVAPPIKRKGPRYTPVSKRQDRPDAILWLLRHHAELADAQVGRLVGTTKPTIQSIRDRSHWNINNLKPVDPVQLGLCSQADLDEAVQKAARRKERAAAKLARERRAQGLEPLEVEEETTAAPLDAPATPSAPTGGETIESVFGASPTPQADDDEPTGL
ncbi:MAG: cell cycle transcriptional regulator TrcR [Alphaproteobacteria bacterium]